MPPTPSPAGSLSREVPRTPGLAVKARVAVPILSFASLTSDSVNGSQSTSGALGPQLHLLDASLAFEFGERWMLEAGGGYVEDEAGTKWIEAMRKLGYFRGGPLLNVARGRAWTTNFQPLLGILYRGYIADRSGGGIMGSGSATVLATGAVAIDATRWWASGWGFNFRVRFGMDFRLASWGQKSVDVLSGDGPDEFESDDLKRAIEFGVDLGLAFRWSSAH